MTEFPSQGSPIDLYEPIEPDLSLPDPFFNAENYAPEYDTLEETAAPIKGSWEAILQEAQQLATQQNDEAIPLFDKLVNRLSKLSANKRYANEGRLQKIFIVAAMNGQSYLTLRGRYDDALAMLTQLETHGDEHEQAYAQFQRAMVLFMAERNDEAIEAVRVRTTSDDADISDWGQLVISHLRLQQIEEADAALAEAEQWMQREFTLGVIGPEEQPEWLAYVETLRADVALRKQAWDEAAAYFDKAIAIDGMYAKNMHLFYTSLLQAGQPTLALRYIVRDTGYPIRMNFWQGVAEKRLGNSEKAEAAWQRVLEIDLEQNDEPSFSEYVLTHYYLGDEERIGLSNILRILQEEQRYDWQTLFLAGLGWAIQEDVDSTMTNFQFSLNQRRTAAMGKRLPYQTWTYCQDLLSATMLEKIKKYFDTEWQ